MVRDGQQGLGQRGNSEGQLVAIWLAVGKSVGVSGERLKLIPQDGQWP